jgi:hypothetical protein
MQEQSKTGKNQISIDKHSSFDGLIQEDIHLAVKGGKNLPPWFE